METPDTSIRRAPRTYGRRRDPVASDVDAAFPAESSASSNSSPTFSESSRDVPPSSDFDDSFTHADDDDAADDAPDDDEGPMLSKYHFGGVKEKMKEIDMQFDDMDDAPPRRLSEPESEEGPAERRSRPTHGISAGDDDPADDDGASVPKCAASSGTRLHKGESLPLSAQIPDDPFGGPLPERTESSQPVQTSTTPPAASASPSPRIRRVARRRPVAHASDSDADNAQRSSPETSPGALHPINTPTHNSSPTPPTTQEMAKGKGKGKEKARSETPAEDADGELPTLATSKAHSKSKGKRKEKEKRVKAPTRKEREETQKAMARIKADQQVGLQREDKRMTLTSLWSTLAPKLAAAAAPRDGPAAPREEPDSPGAHEPASEGISDFSSPAHDVLPVLRAAPKPSALRFTAPARGRSRTVEPQPAFVSNGLLGPVASSSRARTRPRTPSPAGNVFAPTGLLAGESSHGAADADESSDEDLPDVSTLLQRNNKQRADERARQQLLERKKQFLQKNPPARPAESDSDLEIIDDDMHVVAREEEQERKAMKARHIRPSVGRKNQLSLAGRAHAVSPTKRTPVRRARQDLEVLQAAAVPAFSAEARAESRKAKGKEKAGNKISSKDLNQLLLRASEKQSKQITAQKEQEFYKRGVPRDRMTEEDVAKEERIKELIERGMLTAQKRDFAEDDEEDGSDGEWVPDAVTGTDDGEQADEEQENRGAQVRDSEYDSNAENEDENLPRTTHRRQVLVLDSDEDEENVNPRASMGRVLVADSSMVLDEEPQLNLNHRGSVSSMDERLEEGTDKENDMRLMFDRGDDKENTAVAGPSTFALSPRGLVRGRGSLFLSESSGSLPVASQESLGERTPLRELSREEEDEDVFASSPTRLPFNRQGTPGTPKRRQEEPESPGAAPAAKSQGLAAFFEPTLPQAKGKGRAGDDDKPCGLQPAAVIDSGGFSEIFEPTLKNTSSAQSKGIVAGFSQFMTPAKDIGSLSGLAAGKDSLSLSLESNLQPSIHVDENLVRKADELFEKEQEAVAERALAEAVAKDAAAAKLKFVNENGFFTQTEPQAALPAWAMSPTSPLFAESSPAFQHQLKSVKKPRQPLGTLALALEEAPDSDDGAPAAPRRLRKRASTPEPPKGGYRSSASPSPVKVRNAFEVLGRAPQKLRAPEFKKKLAKSAFIEGEAEESDEDAGYGFGMVKKKNDEEELDGEDQDRMLEGLVDDAAMDDDTLNEEKVLEKVQEHRAIDDALEEKIARDAAEGKLRIKRRNRLLDFEDEDSDDEDEDAKRRRQRMAKKRRIEGDTLEQLAGNPETQAFVEAYRAEIEDDNEEFAHLAQDEMSLTFIGGDDEGGEEEQDDENEPPEEVSTVDLREQLRRVARGEETVKTIDTNDVNWLDADEDMDDENLAVNEIASSSKGVARPGAKQAPMEWEIMRQSHRDSAQDLTRQQKWARSEGGSRNAGTGRASAVTGIGKSARAGSGSMPGRRGEQGQSRDKPAAKLGKAPSVLSAVSSRRARFG